jgi:rhodanese-related sulfurtransferase
MALGGDERDWVERQDEGADREARPGGDRRVDAGCYRHARRVRRFDGGRRQHPPGHVRRAESEDPGDRYGGPPADPDQRGAIVLDSRKYSEYASGYIPGAWNAAPELGASPEAFVANVERLVDGDKTRALVLYCNGQYCEASRRLSEQLLAAGFTNVRRYQIGIPVWRALGGATETEIEAVRRVYELDKTAVFLDARSAEEFRSGSLSGARNIPPDALEGSMLRAGAGEGALPSNDFNTRIVVYGRDATQARALAEAVTRRAMHNVAYFSGTFEDLQSALH